MNSNALYIRQLLLKQKDSIDGLAAENKEFLSLCDDYDACVDALKYWAASEKPEAGARVDEYRELIGTLKIEIAQNLEKYMKRERNGGGGEE